MKESDRKFEKLLKEAVCSYHKEEMDALPSEEELQDIQLSDDFYRKMDGLVKKQKRRWQYRFVRYGAVAASFLLFTFGTVGAAAYALMGAENFKAFFKKHAKEYHVADSAVMDLKGLIKSGNRFSMIVEGTLKQQDQIVTAGGPQEEHAYSFLNTDVNAEQDLMASGTYYYQEDDKSLASNQFVYVTNYSAEAGFDSDQYEFTFEDFGYYQEDGTEDEAESTDDEVSAYSALEDSGILENPISICSGTWKFTVDMDQAKDISYKKVCDQTVSDGEDDVKINRIVLSPMGCSIYITLPQSQKDSGKYFDNVHIRLKNGSLLSEEYYEMGIADCELSGDDEAADAVKVSRELDFDFRVPIDISQVKAIEIFGESIEVEACK